MARNTAKQNGASAVAEANTDALAEAAERLAQTPAPADASASAPTDTPEPAPADTDTPAAEPTDTPEPAPADTDTPAAEPTDTPEPTREERAEERAAADDPPETPADKRKRLAREAAAKVSHVERFTPADECEWVPVESGGQAAVCLSAPNQKGETFFYVVFQHRGRDISIPLCAIEALEEAGQI